jgi:hypothetical protein
MYTHIKLNRKYSLIQLEVIGGADKYMAVCRICHREPVVSRSPQKQTNNEITKSMEVNCKKSPKKSLFQEGAIPVCN